jgi:hypothetical protein
MFNIGYNFKRYHIFYIPLGKWKMKRIYIQCVSCGKTFVVKDELKKYALDIYKEVKERDKSIK